MYKKELLRSLIVVVSCTLGLQTCNAQNPDRDGTAKVNDGVVMKQLLASELGNSFDFGVASDANALSSKNRSKQGLLDAPIEISGGLVPRSAQGVSDATPSRIGTSSFADAFNGIEVKKAESVGALPKDAKWLTGEGRSKQGMNSLVKASDKQFSVVKPSANDTKTWKGDR